MNSVVNIDPPSGYIPIVIIIKQNGVYIFLNIFLYVYWRETIISPGVLYGITNRTKEYICTIINLASKIVPVNWNAELYQQHPNVYIYIRVR